MVFAILENVVFAHDQDYSKSLKKIFQANQRFYLQDVLGKENDDISTTKLHGGWSPEHGSTREYFESLQYWQLIKQGKTPFAAGGKVAHVGAHRSSCGIIICIHKSPKIGLVKFNVQFAHDIS